MFVCLPGNTALHMRKERLPVIRPIYVSNKLWTNCAELVIMASLLSKARIVAEGSGESIDTLLPWKKHRTRDHEHEDIWQRIISQTSLSLLRNSVYTAEIQHHIINNSHLQRPKRRPWWHSIFIWAEKKWVLNPAKSLFISVAFTHVISPTGYCHLYSAWSMPIP